MSFFQAKVYTEDVPVLRDFTGLIAVQPLQAPCVGSHPGAQRAEFWRDFTCSASLVSILVSVTGRWARGINAALRS